MDVIESNYNHACMHTMRTLYARDADAICTRHEIRPRGGATLGLGGLREMQRRVRAHHGISCAAPPGWCCSRGSGRPISQAGRPASASLRPSRSQQARASEQGPLGSTSQSYQSYVFVLACRVRGERLLVRGPTLQRLLGCLSVILASASSVFRTRTQGERGAPLQRDR